MDCSLPGSSIHGIFQAIVLEWVAISFSRGSSPPRDWTRVSCIVGRRFTVWAIWVAQAHPWGRFGWGLRMAEAGSLWTLGHPGATPWRYHCITNAELICSEGVVGCETQAHIFLALWLIVRGKSGLCGKWLTVWYPLPWACAKPRPQTFSWHSIFPMTYKNEKPPTLGC